jgi:hypothetical protein
MRDPSQPISAKQQEVVERSNLTGPERLVPSYNDANTVEDILCELLAACDYPDGWDEAERYQYPTIQGTLSLTLMRLDNKLAHERNRTRHAWFSRATEKVKEARRAFAMGNYADGRTLSSEAYDLIERGNKAHRQKAAFVVGPDGTARRA